jgi:hypothetical protein
MALPLRRANGSEYVTIRINPARVARLVTQAREIEQRFIRETKKGGFIENTNRIALHRIQQQAVKNLKQSMASNKRPDFSTGRLEKAIVNDNYSTVTPTHLEFLVRSKIFPDVPYYASLEYGDRSQIGRNISFLFLGARKGPDSPNFSSDHRRQFNRGHKPSGARNNTRGGIPRSSATGVSDRIVGPREYSARYGRANAFRQGRRFRVIIRRPVPRYAYGQKAGDLFLSSRAYKPILDGEVKAFLAATGVKLGR